MVAFHLYAASLHGQNHFGTQVLIVIGGRHGEVAFAVARPISQIVLFPARVPAPLFGVNIVEAVLLALVEAHVVENEKLGLGAEICRVGNAGGGQVHLGLPRDITGIAVVALLGDGIDHVAHQHKGGNGREGIEQMKIGVGPQQHVALVDARPAANRRAVDTEAVLEARFRQLLDWIGNVVPEAGNVGETQVENLRVIFLRKRENGLGISHEDSLRAAVLFTNLASDREHPAGGQAATIGRVVQTEESKASGWSWQFDCSYSGDNATLY